MKLQPILSAHPIHVMAAEVTLELSSFTGAALERPERVYEFKPNLLAHATDLRNLISVQNWDAPERMEELHRWELANTAPTVEYLAAWIFRRRAAARPRPGYSAETSPGNAAAATWIFRGDGSRCRRGCDVDIP